MRLFQVYFADVLLALQSIFEFLLNKKVLNLNWIDKFNSTKKRVLRLLEQTGLTRIFSKPQSKFLIDYPELFQGGTVVHRRPIFMMIFDPKNGGDQCRWKLHYVGCHKECFINDKNILYVSLTDCPVKFHESHQHAIFMIYSRNTLSDTFFGA